MTAELAAGGELPEGLSRVANDTGEPEQVVFEVTASRRLNVRAEPSLEAAVLDVVDAGAVLAAVGQVDGWVQLKDNGYVKAEFVV